MSVLKAGAYWTSSWITFLCSMCWTEKRCASKRRHCKDQWLDPTLSPCRWLFFVPFFQEIPYMFGLSRKRCNQRTNQTIAAWAMAMYFRQRQRGVHNSRWYPVSVSFRHSGKLHFEDVTFFFQTIREVYQFTPHKSRRVQIAQKLVDHTDSFVAAFDRVPKKVWSLWVY